MIRCSPAVTDRRSCIPAWLRLIGAVPRGGTAFGSAFAVRREAPHGGPHAEGVVTGWPNRSIRSASTRASRMSMMSPSIAVARLCQLRPRR